MKVASNISGGNWSKKGGDAFEVDYVRIFDE